MKNPERVAALLAELRTLTETDFERHRLDVLEHDLTEPLMPEVIDDTHQRFNGVVYKKTTNGHFNRALGIQQAVWMYFNGDIPDGCEIHHVDQNKANNDLSNLRCLTKGEHVALHASTAPVREYVCLQCGQTFASQNRTNNNKFCSKSCCSKWRRSHRLEERVCPLCGKIFTATVNKPKQFCSAHCAGVYSSTGNLRIPIETRNEIRRLFVKGSREFGEHALARKFNISRSTVQRILRENQ